MKYTLEIQKRLLQVENGNLSPHEKALLLKEAIRIADENDDPQWAVEMRLSGRRRDSRILPYTGRLRKQ